MLLIEDSPGDVYLVTKGLSAWERATELRVISDGEDAFQHLAAARNDASALPDLVILDLGLPRRGGLELLSWMRSEPALRRIPVVVFTSSQMEVEKLRARGPSPDPYLVKPIELDHYLAAIASIESHWAGRENRYP